MGKRRQKKTWAEKSPGKPKKRNSKFNHKRNTTTTKHPGLWSVPNEISSQWLDYMPLMFYDKEKKNYTRGVYDGYYKSLYINS